MPRHLMIRNFAAVSALSMIGLGAVACGGGQSTATVCANLQKDGQSDIAALQSEGSSVSSLSELKALDTTPITGLASIVKNDGDKASDSSLKTAADNFASQLDKFATDIKAGDPATIEADTSTLESDQNAVEAICPNLKNAE